jgi:Protein of unknown function (DUF2938)
MLTPLDLMLAEEEAWRWSTVTRRSQMLADAVRGSGIHDDCRFCAKCGGSGIGGLPRHRGTLLPALAFGLLTLFAPFFIMQPAMGADIASSRMPNPAQARLRSVITHMVCGIGLYGAAMLSALLIRP